MSKFQYSPRNLGDRNGQDKSNELKPLIERCDVDGTDGCKIKVKVAEMGKRQKIAGENTQFSAAQKLPDISCPAFVAS